MNRRGMLQSALAALAVMPTVGVGPLVAAPSMCPITLALLREARDVLLPGLYNYRNLRDIELSITISHEWENLAVRGYSAETKRELGFVITKQSIVDDVYKAQLNPGLADLVRLLALGDAEYDRLFGAEGYVS